MSSRLGFQARVIAPCFVRPQGLPVILFLISPKGRAERQGVSPRPRRPHVLAYGQPARRFRGTRAVAQPNAEDR